MENWEKKIEKTNNRKACQADINILVIYTHLEHLNNYIERKKLILLTWSNECENRKINFIFIIEACLTTFIIFIRYHSSLLFIKWDITFKWNSLSNENFSNKKCCKSTHYYVYFIWSDKILKPV